MRFLVVQTPKHEIPLEQVSGLLSAEREWYDRNREYLEAYGWFVDRGGFGLVDVPDLKTLNRINKEHPFAYKAKHRSGRSSMPTSPSSSSAPCSSRKGTPFLPRQRTEWRPYRSGRGLAVSVPYHDL